LAVERDGTRCADAAPWRKKLRLDSERALAELTLTERLGSQSANCCLFKARRAAAKRKNSG
jgi:hypothetical protein